MPRYEYRCRACGDTFLADQSGEPAACPQGHDDSVKPLTTVGIGGLSSGGGSASVGGGGGCGG